MYLDQDKSILTTSDIPTILLAGYCRGPSVTPIPFVFDARGEFQDIQSGGNNASQGWNLRRKR